MFDPFRRLGQSLLILSILGLGSSTCLPGLTPQPEPSPEVLTVQITPTLNTLRPLLKSCIVEHPGAGLVVLESPAPDLAQSDLSFQWGANNLPKGYAAILGNDSLVFIVHPENPVGAIQQTDLQAIYRGTQREWPQGEPVGDIQPWAYPANMDIQNIFSSVSGISPFPENAAALAPDPAAMIEVVAGNPAALGFLPRRWINNRVKEVRVEGLAVDLLRQPILALSKSEPQGPIRSWLLCLQEKLAE